MVLTCAFNKGVCPSVPTGAPNYGHVPVDMALKNPHVQAAWTCSPCRETPGVRLPCAPGTAPQKNHTTESESAIRAHKAVSTTNARFPNSVVSCGNEHMSTKPRREIAQPLSTATYPHTNAHAAGPRGPSPPSRRKRVKFFQKPHRLKPTCIHCRPKLSAEYGDKLEVISQRK